MINDWDNRTKLLIKENYIKISQSNVLIVGLGGVGGTVAEMLCRSGVGKLTLVDGDLIDKTNLNRQIFTNTENIGKIKVDEIASRLKKINPDIQIRTFYKFLKEDDLIDVLNSENYDCVIDAIDTIAPKVSLLYNSFKLGLKVFSSMGSGGKLNPTLVKTDDISKSYGCGLAKVVRQRLKKLGIEKGIKVVFSPENIVENSMIDIIAENKKTTLGTISYMPAVFGIYLSWLVIDSLISK